MRKQKQQKPLKEGWIMAQQIVKDSKGGERIVNKPIPEHLSKKPKLMKRMNIILQGESAFVTAEQVEQEKETFYEWTKNIDSVVVLEGALGLHKKPYQVEMLNERIKELTTPKKEPKAKKEPVTPETPQQ